MKNVTRHSIDGLFVESQGRETPGLIGPTMGETFGEVTPGDVRDIESAVAAVGIRLTGS